MSNLKSEEASGSSGILLEVLKIGWEPCLKSLTAIFSNMFFESKMSQDVESVATNF